MKKGFTLIEVMVAVVIVMIATFSVLSLSGNTKHLISLFDKNNEFRLKATVLVNDRNGSNLYENLIDFNITNDEIIKTLKKEKLKYIISVDSKDELKNFKLTKTIKKLKIYNKTNQIIIYEVEIK